MSALKEFQSRHGAAWSQLKNSELFLSALALANSEKLSSITRLTDAQIDQHGKIVLADLRGHMNYELALLGLDERKEFVFQDIGSETYPSPVQEAFEEASAEEGVDEPPPSGTFFLTPGPKSTLKKRQPQQRKKKK